MTTEDDILPNLYQLKVKRKLQFHQRQDLHHKNQVI